MVVVHGLDTLERELELSFANVSGCDVMLRGCGGGHPLLGHCGEDGGAEEVVRVDG